MRRPNALNFAVDRSSSGERGWIVPPTLTFLLFIDGKNPCKTLRRVRAAVGLGSQTDEKLSRLTVRDKQSSRLDRFSRFANPKAFPTGLTVNAAQPFSAPEL